MKDIGSKKIRISFLMCLFAIIACMLCACGDKNAKHEYVITYDLNGGFSNELINIVDNSRQFTLPAASKEGYKFCGWYDNADFEGNNITVIPVGNLNDFTLYAKFLKVHSITFNAEGGFHKNVTEFTFDDYVELQSASKPGYTFCGWYDNSNFYGDRIFAIENIDKDIELFAKFSLNHYINYDLNGGINNIDNPRYFCEDEQVVLFEPAMTGHSFLGWFENGRKVSAIEIGTMEDVYLQARWEIANYKLTWDLKGGISDVTYPMQYTYGIGINEQKFVYPTKEGMIFAGWYVDRNNKSEHIKSISETDIGDMTIYAKWVNAICVNSVPQWNNKVVTSSKSGNAAYSAEAQKINVPDELLDILNDGRLGIRVSATMYSNVKSQGKATGTVTSFLIVNGKEFAVSSTSKKGGGYSYLNGFWTEPCDGDWGYSGNQTKTISLTLTSSEINIGYRYYMQSDKTNDKVETSLQFGCTQLVCTYYIV